MRKEVRQHMGMQNTNLDEMSYTVDEFVQEADITKSTFYQWIRQGLISPGTKLNGRERRWKQVDLVDAFFIKDMRNKAPKLVYDGQLASRTVWKWLLLGCGNISALQKAMKTWGVYQQGCSLDETHHENLLLARDLQGSAGRGTPDLAAVFTALCMPSKKYTTYCGNEVDLSDPADRSDILCYALEEVVFGKSFLPAIDAKHPNALFSTFSRPFAHNTNQAKQREDQKAVLRGLSTWLPKCTDLLESIPSISKQNWEYARYCCLLRMAADQQQGKQNFSLALLHNTACETLFFWVAKTRNQEKLRVQPIEWKWIEAQETLHITIPVQWQEKSGWVYLDLPLPKK